MVIAVEFLGFFLGKRAKRRTLYIGHHFVSVGQWQKVVFE